MPSIMTTTIWTKCQVKRTSWPTGPADLMTPYAQAGAFRARCIRVAALPSTVETSVTIAIPPCAGAHGSAPPVLGGGLDAVLTHSGRFRGPDQIDKLRKLGVQPGSSAFLGAYQGQPALDGVIH